MKTFSFFLWVLFFTASLALVVYGQEEFPVGAFMGAGVSQDVLNSFESSGLNTIVWQANKSTKDFLDEYDVMAFNLNSQDWINHYSTGCYSKWESEEDQENDLKIGVKHKGGNYALKDGVVPCWSTNGLTGPIDLLVYGPHYFQAKDYRRVKGAYGDDIRIKFIARFNMALDYDPVKTLLSQPVCRIKVVYTYADLDTPENKYEDVLQEKTLFVSDFPSDGSFQIFDFGLPYEYDPQFPSAALQSVYSSESSEKSSEQEYSDWFSGTGIQFCVDWLGSPALGTLYVDYAEVFDNNGWNDYIINPNRVRDSIETYALKYSNWTNLKYWYAHDEPHSIDAFEPIRTVDEIVRGVSGGGGVPLITHFLKLMYIKMVTGYTISFIIPFSRKNLCLMHILFNQIP
jgi:hypothetical protein